MNFLNSSIAPFFDTSMAFCQYKVWLRNRAPVHLVYKMRFGSGICVLSRSDLISPPALQKKQGSRLSILMALSVMINASAKLAWFFALSSDIIGAELSDRFLSILKKQTVKSRLISSYYVIRTKITPISLTHLSRQSAPTPKVGGWLILSPFSPTTAPQKKDRVILKRQLKQKGSQNC